MTLNLTFDIGDKISFNGDKKNNQGYALVCECERRSVEHQTILRRKG